MKDGLENSFKEALNNFELPYDAQAWESLNKKLSAKKWYQATQIKWSAALMITIGITAYFVLVTAKTKVQEEIHATTIQKEKNPATTPAKIQNHILKETLPHNSIIHLMTPILIILLY